MRRRQVQIFLLIWMAGLLGSPSALAEVVYRWADENGIIHFTDSLSNVPSKYREKANRSRFQQPLRPVRPILPPSDSTVTVDDTVKPKSYEIPYTAYEGTARRIIVKVKLNGSVTAPLALDTGAPETVLFEGVAEELGLFEGDGVKLIDYIGGIGGTVPAIRTVIDRIEIEGITEEFVPTTVTDTLSEAFQGLIGMDVLGGYAIRIDPVKQVVVMEELPHRSELPGGHDQQWWENQFSRYAESRTAWKEFFETLGEPTPTAFRFPWLTQDEMFLLVAFADHQYRESDKLLDQLHQYARRFAVPMHWREY